MTAAEKTNFYGCLIFDKKREPPSAAETFIIEFAVVENVFQLESKKFFFSDDVNECFMSFALGFFSSDSCERDK